MALVDAASTRLAGAFGVTESVAKHIGLDALYVAALTLALTTVPPLLRTLPGLGEAASRGAAITIVALLPLFVYDLAKVVHRTFESAFHALLDRIVSAVSEGEA